MFLSQAEGNYYKYKKNLPNWPQDETIKDIRSKWMDLTTKQTFTPLSDDPGNG